MSKLLIQITENARLFAHAGDGVAQFDAAALLNLVDAFGDIPLSSRVISINR
jgi:hypothetical protein